MTPRSFVLAPPRSARREATTRLCERTGIAFATGYGLFAILTLPKLLQVWSTGIFPNPDDAMRAVQVRDFMAGQGWFDLVPHRLSPDHPFQMHWSRLIDAPLALLTRVFGLVLARDGAELAMRLVEPAALFAAALGLMLATVRDLLGRRALLPAALLLTTSVEFVGNFLPGHIHHHGAQATLLLAIGKLTLDCVRGQGAWRSAALAGALAAISLGVGLQSLPFMAGVGTIFAVNWAWRGTPGASALAGFGSGLAAGALVVFALDVPPALYTQGACDAFSAAHLLAALVYGLGSLGLAALARDRLGRAARFVTLGGLAALMLATLAALYPSCLGDPLAGIDPLLRQRWLADVGEALPLWRLIARDPAGGLVLALTLCIGWGATAFAWRDSTTGRGAWLSLLFLGAIGVGGTIFQVRVAPSTCAFLIPGVTWLVLRSFDAVATRPNRPALLVAILVGLVGNGAGLTALAGQASRFTDRHPNRAAGGMRVDPTACFEPAAYTALAALPRGLVLSTIDPGSTMLAYTPHSVLAAPYHRNTYGNRVALLALDAPPPAAMALIAEARAAYIVLCRFSNETAETVLLHPDSLSAHLLSGDLPPGVVRLSSSQDTLQIFRVERRP